MRIDEDNPWPDGYEPTAEEFRTWIDNKGVIAQVDTQGPKQSQTSKAKESLIQWLDETFPDMVTPEFVFHKTRKWRIDWAFVDLRVGVEYDGLFGGKAHRATSNVMRDGEKSNEAQLLGWILIRVNASTIASGKAKRWITEAVRQRSKDAIHGNESVDNGIAGP